MQNNRQQNNRQATPANSQGTSEALRKELKAAYAALTQQERLTILDKVQTNIQKTSEALLKEWQAAYEACTQKERLTILDNLQMLRSDIPGTYEEVMKKWDAEYDFKSRRKFKNALATLEASPTYPEKIFRTIYHKLCGGPILPFHEGNVQSERERSERLKGEFIRNHYETFLGLLEELEASQQFEGQYEACNIRKYDFYEQGEEFLCALGHLTIEIVKRGKDQSHQQIIEKAFRDEFEVILGWNEESARLLQQQEAA